MPEENLVEFHDTILQPQFNSFERVALRRLINTIAAFVRDNLVVQNIDDLLDVDAALPNEGDVLRYRTDTWEAEVLPAVEGPFNLEAEVLNADRTLGLTDNGKLLSVNGSYTITIPTQATVAFEDDTEVWVFNRAGALVTIAGGSVAVIGNEGDTPTISAEGQWLVLKRESEDVWLIYGDLDARSPNAYRIVTESGTSVTVARNIDDANGNVYVPPYIRFTNAGAVAATIPPASTGDWVQGDTLELEQAGSGAVTITAGAGVTLNVNSALTLVTNGQYSVAGLQYVGSDVWTVFGNLVPA